VIILVQHILEDGRKRLAVLTREALVCEAAGILANPGTPLVVVCDGQGIAVGVVSKTDIMKALISAGVDAVNVSTGAVMTNSVFFLSCRPNTAASLDIHECEVSPMCSGYR
jgi:CBS domain-containing protein